jgi:hypothetical protein
MLDGVRSNTIVVGAYTDGRGGICPMLAAHRNGGRTSFLSFARAWDAFARAESVRPATARELRVLEDLLVASLAEEPGGDVDLAGAIADHRAVVERRRRSAPEILARRLRPSKARSRSRPDAPASDPARPPAPEAGAVRTAS